MPTEGGNVNVNGKSNGASDAPAPDPTAEPELPADLRLGGMALRNGLLIHGPTSWSVAARSPSGEIGVASGRKPDFGGNRVAQIPLLRGPVRLAEAFAVIPLARKALPSSRLPMEDVSVIAAAVAAMLLGGAVRGRAKDGRVGPIREGVAGALGLMPALVALGGGELAAYHGVEHKAIAAYESGEPDPMKAAKEHQRCGSNLVGPMMILSTIGQLAVDRIFEKPGPIARGASAIASISLAVEAFAFAERNPDSPFGHAVHAGGDTIQRLFATREPTPEQLEVGVAAISAVLEAERLAASPAGA